MMSFDGLPAPAADTPRAHTRLRPLLAICMLVFACASPALVAGARTTAGTLWQPEHLGAEPTARAARAVHEASLITAGDPMDSADLAAVAADPKTFAAAAIAAERVVSAAAGPRTTVMQCLGTETTTRACHFQDLYYNIETKRFIYFGLDSVKPEMFGYKLEDAKDPWLRLIAGVDAWRGDEKENQFFLNWKAEKDMPPEVQVAYVAQPLHLRAPWNVRSFGHFIRDTLLPLIDLPMRFGRDPTAFDWVRWHSYMDRGDWQEETRVVEHYRGLFNNRPSVTWQQVIDKALAEHPDPSGVRFIQFSELIAGQGPVDIMTHARSTGNSETRARWAQMCDPFPFTAMREVAYRNHGLQVASVHELEPFVLFMDGRAKEKRLIANGKELIPSLQEKFPGVRMEHVEISDYTLEEQLRLLSQATVVVTNVGSRSFRLIYLPNGAHVILVGPPEYEFVLEQDKDKAEPPTQQLELPFYEIDGCWGYIGYVKMLTYHVESEAEAPVKPWVRPGEPRGSDIILDEQKITDMLRLALETNARTISYSGSGALGAYDPTPDASA